MNGMKKHKQKSLDVIIEQYQQHLMHSQGLTPGTIHWHKRQTCQFLQAIYGERPINLDELDAKRIHDYVSDLCNRYSPKTVSSTVSTLRSFFRFAEITGMCCSTLCEMVPSPALRGARQVPKYLTKSQLSRFLSSFNTDVPADTRNRAIVLCLVRLGLRAGEVVALKLDDFDWRNDVVRLSVAKGRRHYVLPLALDLREALIDYLRNVRPKSSLRTVFLSLRPEGRSLTAGAVSRITARALKRAGINAPCWGAHLFRHTVATHLVQHGSSVKEIADFLRHKSLDTTVVYAKVNFPLLQSVVQPWPEIEL